MGTLSVNVTAVESEPDRPATHRFQHDAKMLFRKGPKGYAQIRHVRGPWYATDYPNSALAAGHPFMPLETDAVVAALKP